jgi:hypothetical protein
LKEEKPKSESDVKEEGIKSEITPKDQEAGLGDDSNAPNESSEQKPNPDQEAKPSESKRDIKSEPHRETDKKEKDGVKEDQEEDKDTSTTLTKRRREEKGGAGQRTKVVRREDDSDKAVSISYFFAANLHDIPGEI